MSYLQLNKRQITGEILESVEFVETNNLGSKHNSSLKLIKLDNPYKTGVKYSVVDNTINAFCSSDLFVSLNDAYNKYNLMLRNCSLINNDEFKLRIKSK